ncbi:MAG: CidA/LrgA family protein [Lautropia sp.]|nr:CidA/LrgA family protein [Lautropia sp.]
MLAAITILLLYQLIGEVITQAFNLPIPGPVIGMVLLFITLVLRGGPDEKLRETSRTLLQYLSMLFIPAGAGVMLHFGTLRTEWLPILLAASVGTLIVIVLTAKLMQHLINRQSSAGGDDMTPGASCKTRALNPPSSQATPAPTQTPRMAPPAFTSGEQAS